MNIGLQNAFERDLTGSSNLGIGPALLILSLYVFLWWLVIGKPNLGEKLGSLGIFLIIFIIPALVVPLFASFFR